MRILVTGFTGQLGYDVARECIKRGYEVIGSGAEASSECEVPYRQMDITQADEVGRILEEIKPDAVVHCAAWTDVDGAEKAENREKVMAVNAYGTENIAKAVSAICAKMIYISSDYVFNGEGSEPWRPEDERAPLNVYGASKLAGERAAEKWVRKLFVVRTSWVFGINGKNFVKTMLRIGKQREEVRVVNDQVGSPAYTADLARLLVDMAETERYGVYHAANEGEYISWFDFCEEIYRQAGLKTKVIPVSTAEYGKNLAKRPLNSRMDKSKLKENGFSPLPAWQDALKRYLKELDERHGV